MSSPLPPRWLRLALVAGSLAVGLAGAETALRLCGAGAVGRGSPWYAGGNHPRDLFRVDPQLGYTLRPGFTGKEISMTGEFETSVAVDAAGFRSAEHSAPDRCRVLAVGDSMTYGEGVEAAEAFPALLERELGARVIDAGVPGYGSPQMRGLLARLSPTIHPALVVATLAPVWDAPRCLAPFVYLDGYIVASSYRDRLLEVGGNLFLMHGHGALGRFTARLQAHSAVARLALPLAAHALATLRGGDSDEAEALARGVRSTAVAVRAMEAMAREAGARFLLVLVDSPRPDFLPARDALEHELAGSGVDVLELDRLAPGVDWGALHYPRDLHWNVAGHRQVAALLAPAIRERLASCSGAVIDPR